MSKKRAKQVSEMSDEELLGFKEEGLEEETMPFEMVKPFKKAAIANADMEGTAAGNALDALLPDSPLVLAGQVGRGMKGIKGMAKHMTGGPPKTTFGTDDASKALGSTRDFTKNASVSRSSEGTLGYHKPDSVSRQIQEETASTFRAPPNKASEPMWKQKERAAGRPIYAELRAGSKGVIGPKKKEEASRAP